MRGEGAIAKIFQSVVSDLAEAKVKYALVGGFAVASYAIPRMTKDVDLCVAVRSDSEAEAVIRFLIEKGYRIVATLEHVSGRLATVRFVIPGSVSPDAEVDLLFSSCGIEDQIVSRAKKLTVLGQRLHVASLGHLIAMKVLSESPARLTDRSDLLNLIALATAEDLKAARSALRMITRRKYHRGKNLLARLDKFIGKFK